MDRNNKYKKDEFKEYYYNLFWELYNEKYMCLGKRWIRRIASKHYSHITMKKTCIILKWFNDNFDKNKYYMCLETSKNASFRVFVYGKYDDKLIRFVCFETKNKRYIPTFDANKCEYKNVDQCEYKEGEDNVL